MNISTTSAIGTYAACVFEPGDIVEVRTIREEKVSHQWHAAGNLAEQHERLTALNSGGANIYVGANPRKNTGGTTGADVPLARCLFVDFDGDITEAEVRQRIIDRELPAATLIVASGHGFHAYWRLAEPMTDLAAWTIAQKRLIAALDSDPVPHDAPRVLRLPGFSNVKREPHVPCTIVDSDSSRAYSLGEILACLPPMPEPPKRKPAGPIPDTLRTNNVARCRAYIAKLPEAIQGQGGSAATLHAACECYRFGLTDDEAMAVMLEYSDRCSPPWSERELQHKLDDASKKIAASGEFGVRLTEGRESAANGGTRRQSDTSSHETNPGVSFSSILLPESRTEIANAKRLIAHRGNDLRYVASWKKWLTWDGASWALDNGCRVESYAKEVAAQVWNAVTDELPRCEKGEIAKLTGFANSTASAHGIQNLIELARSEPGVPVDHEQLDADPWLLNVANGTVDLRTGKLRPHQQADLLTKISPVAFDAHATCPIWLRFVFDIMRGDTALVGFLQRLAGYWLTGSVRDHVLPIAYGVGANGKSVFFGTIQAMLGTDYATTAAPDLLLAKQHAQHPTEIADLHGRRLVTAIEIEAGRRLAESLVKSLTGADRLKGRRMKEDFWEFTPTAKFVIAANHRPIVRGTDRGIWRRLRAIPFTVCYWDPDKGETGPAELMQDKTLPDKLLAELPGILNWAIEGCLAWQASGLQEPATVTAATEDYRAESDLLGDFIDECCLVEPHSKVSAGRLYEAYTAWCKTNGHEADNSTVLGRKLTERGFEADRSKTDRLRRGISLLMSREF